MKIETCKLLANMLKHRFYCSPGLSKPIYFDLIVLRVTQVNYNDSFRTLLNIPRWTTARLPQIECHINAFDAILCKTTFSFIQRCVRSSNSLITSLMTLACFHESNFYHNYNTCCSLLYNFELPLVMLVGLCLC